jgi:hypothetical protein
VPSRSERNKITVTNKKNWRCKTQRNKIIVQKYTPKTQRNKITAINKKMEMQNSEKQNNRNK